jgi:hypothetical protein
MMQPINKTEFLNLFAQRLVLDRLPARQYNRLEISRLTDPKISRVRDKIGATLLSGGLCGFPILFGLDSELHKIFHVSIEFYGP